MMDPYELVSRKLAEEIGALYVRMVQRMPRMFGVVYSLGSGQACARQVTGLLCQYQSGEKIACIFEAASDRCDPDAAFISGGADHLSEGAGR